MTIWDYVQLYTKLGWVCIPTINGTKRPALSSWKELETRRPTQAELEMWFKDQAVGVAIVTGKQSNLTVVDNDHYKEGSIKLNLNTPLIAISGSGGKHFYFRYNPKIPTFKNEVSGVDVRGEGGLIFAPPMIHPTGKEYIWFTELIEDVRQLPVCPDEIIKYAPVKSKDGFDWLNAFSIKIGARDDTIFRAADSLIAKGFEYEIALALLRGLNATYDPPLKDFLIVEKLRNAIKFINLQKENLDNKERILWPPPLPEAAFHGLAGDITKAIEPHSEADPVALLMNSLTSFGSIIGDKPHFRVEGDKHPARLFVVLSGHTSKARKGTSWGHIKNIFSGLDEDWGSNIQSGLSTGEGLVWNVRDPIEKPSDPGVTDKRCLVVEGEFARTLKVMEREGNTLSAVMRSAWDSGNLRILTKNSSVKATGAHISIIGHITVDELNRYLSATETVNGFGNRFLWCCVKRSKVLPRGGNLSSMNFGPLINELRTAISFAQTIEEITWANETILLWDFIYPELSEGEPGLVGSMTARSEAYVVRLALIYALLDRSNVIKPEHLKAALAVWDYCEASVRYIFQGRSGDPLANKILEVLKNNLSGMTRTDINNYFSRNIDSEQLSITLENQLKLGRIKSEVIQTEGRAKELFSLNSSNSYPNTQKTYLEKLEEYTAENNTSSINDSSQEYEKNEINELRVGNSSDEVVVTGEEDKDEPEPDLENIVDV